MEVPYIEGDSDGALTAAVCQAVSKRGNFKVVRQCGDYRLCGKIDVLNGETVGFRYEQNLGGQLGERLVSTEERLNIDMTWKVVDNRRKTVVLGPCCLHEELRFDFAPDTSPQNDNTFSLGQLDFEPGAKAAAQSPLYDRVGAKMAAILYAWSVR